MIKVLLIEDDWQLSDNIKKYLTDFAEVKQVYDGLEGQFEAESAIYDIILLDWMLPEKSGIDVLKTLREERSSTPVLFLTAKDDIEDKMRGFQFGADDYLTKPFYLEELKMRMISLLKRSGRLQDENSISYGEVVANFANQSVEISAVAQDIQGKEFELLVYFLQNQGAILTKEQIFDRIWGFDSETAITVVEVYMSKLRKHLKGTSLVENLQTIRNVGYLLKKQESK
ncbi:two-component system, OmpR family, response regulator CiaR [Pilibacter termitis]|uniref:Two-component system, OmpR family, response regulator CiaR n=1 Tax=Pilibacter termitis TaxID=263852 RepID=A0A1T4N5A2_9ENTE|nr:response regulator transcription factor [Pilibacter termitis]SJZ74291.1 two-component system, OmpR family, response regulator CiaR [Pilibacter termitis]